MNVMDGTSGDVAARTERVKRELAAARGLIESHESEVDAVLSAVAARLARELEPVRAPAEEATRPASTSTAR